MANNKNPYVAPELWLPYAQEAMIYYNNVVGLLADVDPTPPSTEGELLKMPYQSAIDNIGDVTQIVEDTTTVTPSIPADVNVYVPIMHYGAGITSSQYMSLARGADPVVQLGQYLGGYWSLQIQKKVKLILNTQFEASGALRGTPEKHYKNSADPLTSDDIFDAKAEFGDDYGSMSTMIMHPKALAKFMKDYTTSSWSASELTNNILSTGTVQRWNGLNIITSEMLCPAWDDSGTDKYPTYIISGKPLYMAVMTPLYEEKQKKADTGGSTTEYYYYTRVALGLKGVSYTSSTIPATDTTLATVGSWTKKWDDRNIKVYRIDTPLA